MWITYNRAPADNGHPLGEEVQVEFNSFGHLERTFQFVRRWEGLSC